MKDSSIVTLRYIGAFLGFSNLWAFLSYLEYATATSIAATAVIVVCLTLPVLAGKQVKSSWIVFAAYLILSFVAICCLGMRVLGNLRMVNHPDYTAAAFRASIAVVVVLLVMCHCPMGRRGGSDQATGKAEGLEGTDGE